MGEEITWKDAKEMMDSELKQAVDQFYRSNKIDPERYTDSCQEAYCSGSKRFDDKIAAPVLIDRVEKWISGFDPEDRKHFYRLLGGFTYLTQNAMEYQVYQLSSYIFDELDKQGIPCQSVVFVTVESKDGIKSGADEIASHLWNVNLGRGVDKRQIIASLSKAGWKAVRNARAFVFIDDILATGFTMHRAIEDFFARFPRLKDPTKRFYYTGIKATRSAVRYLEKNLRPLPVAIKPLVREEQIITSAFTDGYIFNVEEAGAVEAIVKTYEDEINAYERKKGIRDYSMGFCQCRLLLAFRYDTPNNTLSTFWKETKNNFPVFKRSANQRPRIDELKAAKRHMTRNAYRSGGRSDENIP